MKYNNIQALVPKDEHFDESGIVNEGGFLSVLHLDAIENSLSSNASAIAVVEGQLDAVNTTLGERDATITTMANDAETAAASAQTQSEKITELNATIANQATELISLGKKSSGTGSTVVVEAAAEVVVEEKQSNGGPVKFDSDTHPANKFADSQRKYDSGLPVKQ